MNFIYSLHVLICHHAANFPAFRKTIRQRRSRTTVFVCVNVLIDFTTVPLIATQKLGLQRGKKISQTKQVMWITHENRVQYGRRCQCVIDDSCQRASKRMKPLQSVFSLWLASPLLKDRGKKKKQTARRLLSNILSVYPHPLSLLAC